MNVCKDKTHLPQRRLGFSKGMVVLSLLLLVAGLGMILSAGRFYLLAGLLCTGLGFGLFFTAGYYWGCDNESCS